MENTIEKIAKQLSFMGDVGAQYRAATALQGAESIEAAIISALRVESERGGTKEAA